MTTGKRGTTPSGWTRVNADRIVGLDLARLLAILGMMTDHLLAGQGPHALQVAVTGFPSTLFAVLGGVSAVLATSRLTVSGHPMRATLSLMLRAIVIIAIGGLLGVFQSPIIIVLVYYGVALILTALLFRLPTAAILCIVVALAVGGPQLNVWVRATSNLLTIGELSYDDPAAFARSVLFTGTYPAVTWLAYMLSGVLIGRLLVDRSNRPRALVTLGSVGAALFAVGAAAQIASQGAVMNVLEGKGLSHEAAEAVATGQGFGAPIQGGWIAVLNAAPHTGSTGDIIKTMGAAMIVITLFVALTNRMRDVPMILQPLQRAGGAPLTVYTLHVLATAAATMYITTRGTEDTLPPWAFGPGALTLQVFGVLLLGTILTLVKRRGPLEALNSAIASLPSRSTKGGSHMEGARAATPESTAE